MANILCIHSEFCGKAESQLPMSAPGKNRSIASAVSCSVGEALMPLAFDRVYSHHFERVIHSGAKQILLNSVERYVAAIGGAYDWPPSGSPSWMSVEGWSE